MLEELLLALVIIEFIGVAYNIFENVRDVVTTRNLAKNQQEALNCQQQSIKLQEEQFKLYKDYSEMQNEQNMNIRNLSYLISSLESRIWVLEQEKKSKPKKAAKKEGETK